MNKPKLIERQFMLPANLHARLKKHAIKHDITMSEIVSNLIKEFLRKVNVLQIHIKKK